jgi:type I restriction enzyme S subunit
MSREWLRTTLGAVTSKIGSGATPRGGKSVYRAAGVAFIRSQNVLDHKFSLEGLAYIDDSAASALKGVTVYPHDVLVNITGDSVARCCMAPDGLNARVSQHVAIVRARRELVDPSYLAAYLVSARVKSQLLQLAGAGATRPALTKGHLQQLPVHLPPLPAQRAIAEVLDAHRRLMDANERLAAICESLAIAQLEQVVERRPVASFATIGRDQLRPAQFADRVVDHFSLPAFDEARLPENCPGDTIMSNKFHVKRPAVLVSKLNPHIPRVWYVEPREGVTALASTELVILEPKDGWSPSVLWAACAAPTFVRRLAEGVTGSTGSHQRIRPQEVLDAPIVDLSAVPQRIQDLVDVLVRCALAARRESEGLALVRDALLSPFVSGELRVRPAADALAGEGM